MIIYIAPDNLYHRTVFTALKNMLVGQEIIAMPEDEVRVNPEATLTLYHAKAIHPQTLKKVQRHYPRVPILLVTQSQFKEQNLSLGYSASVFDISQYVRCFLNDVQRAPCRNLTYKEKLILAELRLGKSNKEIARFYDLPLTTVKYYLNTLYAKLGVQNRGQLKREAIE